MKNLDIILARHNINAPPRHSSVVQIKFNDLTLVLKGSLEYTVNGKTYTLFDGDMIFMPPGTTYVRKNSTDNADYISFNFYTDDKIELPVFLKDAVHSETLMLISAFDKINRRTYLDNKEKNAHILACIISVLEDRAQARHYNLLTIKIIKYLHSNLDKKITLDDIGALTFFSPIYCDSVFKRDIGKSIIDYLIDERIEYAKKLLLDDSYSLSQIAAAVGFNDYNYFSRVFKARSGISPSSYRQMTLDSFGAK